MNHYQHTPLQESQLMRHELYQHTPLQEAQHMNHYQHTPLQESQRIRHEVSQHTPLQEAQGVSHDMYQRTPLQEPQRAKKPKRTPLEDITNLVTATSRLTMGVEREHEEEEEPGSSEKTSLVRPSVPAEPLALFRGTGKLNSKLSGNTNAGEVRKQEIQYGAARRMRMI